MNQPRKQARQARSRATQEAILEATARILESEGRDALTTNGIARRAGVSIGSLYQYYPHKEAILATLMRIKRAELLELMREALAGSGDLPVEQAVGQMVKAGMIHQFSRPRLALELEYVEPQLGLMQETADLAEEMAGVVLEMLRQRFPATGLAEARDVIAICKGMINAEALAGAPGGEQLQLRCTRAVLGYLRECSNAPRQAK
ncbi:TetR/AcrR family transcriptional regulator [Albibacillus kandeliae]|uniref:TetR/AcrR family transcriptional regulator n=1 Tax=Albibacillus kandeliae TaxID=2174228 RepID=UPI000D690185|nr:TetR/AcrR family transcriptional regulator [Albibacillus kandeliae]